jgi:hypothetical protein
MSKIAEKYDLHCQASDTKINDISSKYKLTEETYLLGKCQRK